MLQLCKDINLCADSGDLRTRLEADVFLSTANRVSVTFFSSFFFLDKSTFCGTVPFQSSANIPQENYRNYQRWRVFASPLVRLSRKVEIGGGLVLAPLSRNDQRGDTGKGLPNGRGSGSMRRKKYGNDSMSGNSLGSIVSHSLVERRNAIPSLITHK